MSFYSIILDWDCSHTNPLLRLIATNSAEPPLESVQSWDPGGSYSSIDRSSFRITQVKQHNLKNQFDGSTTAAHICRVMAAS